MTKYSIILALILASWIATRGIAQTPSSQASPASSEPSAATVDMLALLSQMNASTSAFAMPSIPDLLVAVPPDPNAWVVRIVSGGGFTGQYRGLVVASQGTVRCTAEIQCRGTLSVTEVESITRLLSEPVLSKWPQTDASSRPPVSVCSDCIRVWLELRYREKDGTEKMYSTTWDDVSKSSLPDEVRQIYETALTFRR